MNRYLIIVTCLLALYSCNSNKVPDSEKMKVLFVGNSYTYNNDLPGQLKAMADDHSDVLSIEIKSLTPGGTKLKDHLDSSFTMSVLKDGEWDIVIFQGNSLETLKDPIGFKESALTLSEIAIEAGIKVYFFETWARKENDAIYSESWSGGSPAEMQKKISSAYASVTEEVRATVIPIGRTWNDFIKIYSEIKLHSTDGSHPTPHGSYLSACTIFAVLFKQDPTELKYRPDGISESEAELIRTVGGL